MNIEWDYNYYQPWSNNEWLVDEMLVMLDEDVMMHYCIICLKTLKDIQTHGMDRILQRNLRLFPLSIFGLC